MTEEQIKHAKKRAEEIYNERKKIIKKQFNVGKDGYPKSTKEKLEALKKNEFVVLEAADPINDDDDYDYYYNWYGLVRFKKTGPVEDTKGYEAAVKELDKKYNDFMDELIFGKEASTIRAKLEEFEKNA